MSRLIGRDAEMERMARFVRATASGGAVFVLEGEPGIGKSTVWRAGVDLAMDEEALVLSSTPAGSEVTMSFAGLGDLLDEHVDEDLLGELPEPQRNAIEVALLRTAPGPHPTDYRTVAAATRSIIRALAVRRGPIVVAIDDVQWLDGPTALALGFALRRLDEHDPVGVLFALRTGVEQQAGRELAESLARADGSLVRLAALDGSSLGRIVTMRLGVTFPTPLVRRVHEASRGNTFLAIEIARALVEMGMPEEAGAPLPVPPGLVAALRKRLAPLPQAAREALLICAAQSRPTRSIAEVAAEGDAATGLAQALDAGVVELAGDRVSFVHPLFASVIYDDATAGERRGVHARLATIVEDAEERARHFALAVEGPDPTVADMLERAARQAHARGAHTSATELFELAALRTPADREDEIRRRSIEAADLLLLAGDERGAHTLMQPLAAMTSSGPSRAELLLRMGVALFSGNRYASAAAVLAEAVSQPGIPPGRASWINVWCAWATTYTGDPRAGERHAAAAVELAEQAGEDQALATALALLGLLRMWLGLRVDWGLFDRSLALEGVIDPFFVSDLPSFYVAAALEDARGDVEGAKRRMQDLRRRSIDRGDELSLQDVEFSLATMENRDGNFRKALELLESVESRDTIGGGWHRAVRARVLATLGDVGGARRLAEEGIADPEATVMCRIDSLGAAGYLELSLGRADAAVAPLQRAWEEIRTSGFELPTLFPAPVELIEALAAVGEPDAADEIVAWLQRGGEVLDRPLALAHAGRGRALIMLARGDPVDALAALDESLARHELVGRPFELARTRFIHGTVLRRADRKAEARAVLGQAAEAFEAMAAVLWAERARAELDRISGRRPGSDPLTPTEERVAKLAAGGRTNREIAEEMFLSVRTVESHLSRTYHKLGIRSRVDLAAILTR